MENSEKFYSRTYEVTTDMYDYYDRITPQAVVDLFQDIAGKHATAFGCGFKPVLEKGYFWILMRNKFDYISKPGYFEKVIVSTWPHKPDKFSIVRDYLITDLQGNPLVKGSSLWVIVDIKRKMICPTTVLYKESDDWLTRSNYEESIESIRPFEMEFEHLKPFTVLKHQIDHNGHMNNTQYIEEIYDLVTFGNKEEYISSLTICFLKEMKYQDVGQLKYVRKDDKVFVEIVSNDEVKTRAILTIKE